MFDKKELSDRAKQLLSEIETGPVSYGFALSVIARSMTEPTVGAAQVLCDEAIAELATLGLAEKHEGMVRRPVVKRWDFTKGAHVTHPEVDAFLGAILGVCRAHNMSLESADMSLLLVQRLDAKYCCALDEAAVYLAAPEKEEKTS